MFYDKGGICFLVLSYDFWQSALIPDGWNTGDMFYFIGRLHVCPFRGHTLSIKHRVMLVLMWFRCYSTYHLFSALFNTISVSTVKEEQWTLVPKLYLKLKYFIIWPSIVQWHSMSYSWETIPAAVGNIDGSSLEIYRPSKIQQQQYFSGHTIRFIHRW